MKVLISDHPEMLMPDHELETATLKAGLGDDLQVDVLAYTEDMPKEVLYDAVKDADALLTGFLTCDEALMNHAPKLKVISINSTGYNLVDLDAATARGIGVCPVGEYCTWDVSEGAIAYMYALNKNMKAYMYDLERNRKWDYLAAPITPRIEDQTLGIAGFGKIGKCTARKAKGLVKRILVVRDPCCTQEDYDAAGVTPVEPEELFRESDVIVNHMNLTDENYHYFDARAFSMMERHPILINLGRGQHIDEDALIEALENGTVRAFGADVLYGDPPVLENHPLLDRPNVIVTPHTTWYSTTAIETLERISSQNIVYFLTGQKDKVFKLVNEV